jgi:hypothetical protein
MNGRINGMMKVKVSATVDPARLQEARSLTGADSVSEVLDAALGALIERELEQRWLAAHPNDELPGEVPVDLSDLPWDD